MPGFILCGGFHRTKGCHFKSKACVGSAKGVEVVAVPETGKMSELQLSPLILLNQEIRSSDLEENY